MHFTHHAIAISAAKDQIRRHRAFRRNRAFRFILLRSRVQQSSVRSRLYPTQVARARIVTRQKNRSVPFAHLVRRGLRLLRRELRRRRRRRRQRSRTRIARELFTPQFRARARRRASPNPTSPVVRSPFHSPIHPLRARPNCPPPTKSSSRASLPPSPRARVRVLARRPRRGNEFPPRVRARAFARARDARRQSSRASVDASRDSRDDARRMRTRHRSFERRRARARARTSMTHRKHGKFSSTRNRTRAREEVTTTPTGARARRP